MLYIVWYVESDTTPNHVAYKRHKIQLLGPATVTKYYLHQAKDSEANIEYSSSKHCPLAFAVVTKEEKHFLFRYICLCISHPIDCNW